MRQIEVSYHRPIFGKTTYRVAAPSTWNELSKKQLIRVAGLLYLRELDSYRFRIELLRIVCQLKWHHLMMLGGAYLVELFSFVKFIEEEITLTQNKIENIKVGRFRFFGPIGDFSTLTAEEWTAADEAYVDFMGSRATDHLDRLIAILYRKREPGMWPSHSQWKNDYREPYNPYSVLWRKQVIGKIDPRIKFAVLLWYQGCRREWEEVFERVFKNKSEGPESFGWEETIMKLSGSEFGSHEATRKTEMYKLMLKMEVTLKDEEYRKEQEDAMKRKSRI